MNKTYGVRTAVMFGDFLFAQTSFRLAQLGNIEVRALAELLLLLVNKLRLVTVDAFWMSHHANLAARRSFDSSVKSSQTSQTARFGRQSSCLTPT